jgi:hypothetical protein
MSRQSNSCSHEVTHTHMHSANHVGLAVTDAAATASGSQSSHRSAKDSTHSMRAGNAWVGALLALVVCVFPAHSSAQFSPGTVTAHSDEIGSSCSLLDDADKIITVYVFTHVAPSFGLGAVRFRLVSSTGFSATYSSEVIPYVHTGNTQDGLNVAFGTCLSGDILVATVSYIGHGTSTSCSYLTVTGHPQSYFPPNIDVMDCEFYWLPASTDGPLNVNPAGGQCSPWCVVAVNQATWGAVKALYR